MTSYLPGLITGLITGVLMMLLKERLSRNREQRDREKWSTGNLKSFFFDEYLCERIKDCRSKLTKGSEDVEFHDPGAYQNQISIALQRIGCSAFIGAIPLSFLLVMNCFQILSDWVLVIKNVEKFRNPSGNDDRLIQDIPFHRRHAEWLALISFLWSVSQPYRENEVCAKTLSDFRALYKSERFIVEREKLLFENESILASHDLAKLRKKIIQRYSQDHKITR